MERDGDGDTNCSWCTWNDPQTIGKGTGRHRNQNKLRPSIRTARKLRRVLMIQGEWLSSKLQLKKTIS